MQKFQPLRLNSKLSQNFALQYKTENHRTQKSHKSSQNQIKLKVLKYILLLLLLLLFFFFTISLRTPKLENFKARSL